MDNDIDDTAATGKSAGPGTAFQTPPAKKPAGPQADPDLSSQIVATVERQVGDLVKCTRVAGDRYRCNWWAAAPDAKPNSRYAGVTYGNQTVRLSRFLQVTSTPAGLKIIDA